MRYAKTAIAGSLALLLAGACNRESVDNRTREEPPPTAERAEDLQRERNDDISRLEKRVVDVERKYTEASGKVAEGKRTATAGLHEELKEDVNNVKQAVNDLRTTTPENWWERHEKAMSRTADDIEADVARLAGKKTARPSAPTGTTGEGVSTAPFTSRRDRFVKQLDARVEAMKHALDDVKASGPRETELDDTRARLKKLGEDVDRLGTASADDWWDVTSKRVTEYVDRVEGSVGRLDDNKPKS
jgi:hypothetical protein